MKSLARIVCLLGMVLPVNYLVAQEQIAWVADMPTASAMAAEQRRLVLLHFYSDNCEPCVRLEQNVFSQPEVAQAMAQNFLAVRVHAGKNPQLAARYRVNRWPTDVFVTPSGLEVYRTISPQKAGDYIAVLNQVAQQTGIGTSRQWQSPLDQIVRPVAAEAADQAGKAGQAANAVGGQMQQSVAHGQQAVQQFNQHSADISQRGIAAANQWSQAAVSTAQQYGQQANHAQQQFQQEATHVRDRVQDDVATTRQNLNNAARQATDQFGQTAQQTSQQFSQTATGFGQQFQQAVAATGFDRRSEFVPQGGISAPGAPASTPPVAPPLAPVAINDPGTNLRQQEIARPAQTAPPLLPPATATASPPASAATAIAAPQPPVATTATTPPLSQQFIPASQAPPTGLDGFCPVTLLETVARDPSDRTAWRKGDKQYGAIHRGRTYLFVSPEHQQRFLANPDAFAPALAGCDPVRFADGGEMVDGKRAYGLITPDRRIFLFADEASRNRFEQSPGNYSNAIQQALLRSEAGSVYR